MNDSEAKKCPRCNKESLGRRTCPPCDVDMGEHDETDADTNVDHYIHCTIILKVSE